MLFRSSVRCVSGEVIIAAGEPRAELKGNIITNDIKDQYLVVEKTGNELNIRFDANTTFPSFLNGDVTMKVWLPEELVADMDVSGASAGISVAGMQFHNAKFRSVSGAVALSGCAGQTLEAGSTSGAVKVDDAQFASVHINTISGGVAVDGVSGNLDVRSVSGAVKVNDAAGAVSVDNTSGSVSLSQPQKELAPISVGSISGSVELKLHPEAAFDLAARSTSGSLYSDFELLMSGNLKNKVVGTETQGSVNGGEIGRASCRERVWRYV